MEDLGFNAIPIDMRWLQELDEVFEGDVPEEEELTSKILNTVSGEQEDLWKETL
jgi:hypothetical protein